MKLPPVNVNLPARPSTSRPVVDYVSKTEFECSMVGSTEGSPVTRQHDTSQRAARRLLSSESQPQPDDSSVINGFSFRAGPSNEKATEYWLPPEKICSLRKGAQTQNFEGSKTNINTPIDNAENISVDLYVFSESNGSARTGEADYSKGEKQQKSHSALFSEQHPVALPPPPQIMLNAEGLYMANVPPRSKKIAQSLPAQLPQGETQVAPPPISVWKKTVTERVDINTAIAEHSNLALNELNNFSRDVNLEQFVDDKGNGLSPLAIISHSIDETKNERSVRNNSIQLNAAIEKPEVALSLSLTPGDKLLASLINTPNGLLTRDLNHLIDALRVHIQTSSIPNKNSTVLHITLPTLGPVEIQLTQAFGQFQVDIITSQTNVAQLQQCRNDLMERLQKISPAQGFSLSFSDSREGSEQGSRQRRHVIEEWDERS